MLGLYYIVLCIIIGYIGLTLAFPQLKTYNKKTYDGRKVGICKEFLLFPSYFVLGTLIVTWTSYIVAYLSRGTKEPLLIANSVVLLVYTLLAIAYFAWKGYKKTDHTSNLSRGEVIYLFLTTLISVFLMFYTFYIVDNIIHVGFTVYSDFSPHLSMIRSFSKGNNFPTWYTFYAGEDVRYHFMFFFLVGNLEFLGLRLDLALNIPSVMGLMSTYLLLYVLAVKISGKKSVGYLTGLLFTFRSSPSFFRYLADIPRDENKLSVLINNLDYISYTPNEDWGLWNLNVYCNQRHFPFSLAVFLLVIILFMPRLYKMFDNIKEESDRQVMDIKKYTKTIFFTKEGWLVRDYRFAICAGLLAGSIAFWNGATLIALISVLFIMAIFSSNRLEYLITALIATGLSLLQSTFFIKGSPISPEINFGFIVENPNIFNVVKYIFELLGILPILLIIAFIIKKDVDRSIMLAFLGPAIITFTLSLTRDVTVNHKYLMISIMVLGIYAADFVVNNFKKKSYMYKGIAIVLVILLTSTGVYDFTTLVRSNRRSVSLDMNHDLTKWIEENTDSRDIFLSGPYALNQVVLGGPSLYQGWQYFAWSAGYNTEERDIQVKAMYQADSPEELDRMVRKNNIRYIIVDRHNRDSQDYQSNEKNIIKTYEPVFEIGSGQDKLSIYDCNKKLADITSSMDIKNVDKIP